LRRLTQESANGPNTSARRRKAQAGAQAKIARKLAQSQQNPKAAQDRDE